MQNLRVQLQAVTQTSKHQTAHSASNSTTGSVTQRPYRGEWAKPSSINSYKPLSQHKSIDNRVMKDKKSNSNENSGSKLKPGTTQNFLFNTYSANGQSKQSQDKTPGNRNMSLKGWLNPQTSQNQQNSSILKNLLLSSHSGKASNHGQSIESSNSSSNLMLDSGILTALNVQNNASTSKDGELKYKTFNELQNQFDSFNANKVGGMQNPTKPKSELTSVLQSFAPNQFQKHGIKSNKLRMASDPSAQTKLNLDVSSQSKLQSRIEGAISSDKMEEKKLDYSSDDDLDRSSGDINESVVHFKSSSISQSKSQDQCTPKSSVGLMSYKNSIQSSGQAIPAITVSQVDTGHNSGNRRESRNGQKKDLPNLGSQEIQQIEDGFSSHLKQKETFTSTTTNVDLFSSKDTFGQVEKSSTVTIDKFNQFQSTQQDNRRKSQINSKAESRDSKTKNVGNVKSKQKAQYLTNNSMKENPVQSQLPLSTLAAQKASAEVFQYKIKTSTTTTALNTQLNLGQVGKNSSSVPNSHRQTSTFQKKNSLKYSAKVVGQSKPQQNMREKDLNKVNDIEQETRGVQNQELLHLTDEIENVDIKFLYATTDDKGQSAPPNSSNILSPPGSDLKKQRSVGNLIAPQLENNLNKVKILDFDLENPVLDTKQSIRVISRFRPFNKVELDLRDTLQNPNKMIVADFFEDSKSLRIKEELANHSNNNLTFTFDYVFNPSASQHHVFEMVGKGTIEDIMEGYNGTIFAYGQTGSGKTFTMYGQDMFDEMLMGLVPRAARQIFQHIKSQDLEIEYQIRMQMVEIYKEQLRDLLHDSPSQPPDLKIKEDPKRGTYVEGLTDVCIVSEEEMMTVLCTGETMRHVASTSLNQLSSRSHSICMIEIVQKFPNDSEKRGLLNLVDLAGSERVSKSHAQGQALEEAKKINFSLSMLGKVISSLTKNSAYVPYRDSKLTRLLKESLGGNNKTTLIVACSPHQSNIEETMSTLRFAQNAKFIKNNVKINMKTSPEQLQCIIEQLKMELRNCKEEIYKLRITTLGSSQNQTSQKKLECKSNDQSELNSNDLKVFQPSQYESQLLIPETERPSRISSIKPNTGPDFILTLHNRPHQSLLSKNYDLIETNNYRMQMLSLFSAELSNIQSNATPNFISPVKNYEIKLMQLINKNEDLEMKLRSKDKDIEALKGEKEELQSKVGSLEDKLMNYKQRMLVMEKQIAEYESQKDLMMVKEVKQNCRIEDYQSQINVLNQQVQCLEKALEDTELNCQQLMRDKTTVFQKQIKDFLNDTVKYKRIQISEALDVFINKPRTTGIPQPGSKAGQQILQDYVLQEKIMAESDQIVASLNEKDLLQQNIYSLELVQAIEDCPPEITIYLLKQLLIESALANHNLQRILAVNRWRQVIEFGKNKIKAKLCKVQESTIETLETVIEKTRKIQDRLKNRVEKLENYLYENRNQYGDNVLLTEVNPSSSVILRSHHKGIVNQSLVSLPFNTNQQNQKTRIVRTITNKTLGKGFNFIEKSPHSRASAVNQSILSQIYHQGQTKGMLQKQPTADTPLRTGNLNSPAIYNFQSPIRRQNTVYVGRNGQANQTFQQPQVFSYLPQQSEQVNVINIDGAMNERISGSNSVIDASGNNRMSNEIPNASSNIDQMAFEDAIAKFFSQSEQNEDKFAIKTKSLTSQDLQARQMRLTEEEWKFVDSNENIQALKEFIKAKFEQERISGASAVSGERLQQSAQVQFNHNPLFAQYQQNLGQNNSTNNLGAQSDSETNNQQINSHTTNNNLYAQSNDYYDQQNPSSQKGLPCSSSGNYHDNQRQEHVLTLASDYLITSNSVIGPNGLFNNVMGQHNGYLGGGTYYTNEYMDRLQEKIVQLQEEVETQKCRAEEHKKAYYESKKQIEQMRELIEEREGAYTQMIKNEICQWESVLGKFRELADNQLLKKQKEIEKLHEILAQWIDKYQQLEKGGNQSLNNEKIEYDQLLKKTLNHRRNQSSFLSEVMKVPIRRMSSNYHKNLQVQRQSSKHQCQSTNSLPTPQQIDSAPSQNPLIFQTLQSFNTMREGTFDKKVINGDNSPVNQEESCLDIDQSVRQFTQHKAESEECMHESMCLHTYQSQNNEF